MEVASFLLSKVLGFFILGLIVFVVFSLIKKGGSKYGETEEEKEIKEAKKAIVERENHYKYEARVHKNYHKNGPNNDDDLPF